MVRPIEENQNNLQSVQPIPTQPSRRTWPILSRDHKTLDLDPSLSPTHVPLYVLHHTQLMFSPTPIGFMGQLPSQVALFGIF